MRLSPLDIQSQQFRTKMKGLDPREVENFLELTASEFEELIRENGKLKEKLARLSNQYEELKQRELTLKETMMTAQKITEDMKVSARKEAEIVPGTDILRLGSRVLEVSSIVRNLARRVPHHPDEPLVDIGVHAVAAPMLALADEAVGLRECAARAPIPDVPW